MSSRSSFTQEHPDTSPLFACLFAEPQANLPVLALGCPKTRALPRDSMAGTTAPLGPLGAPTRARRAQRSAHTVRTCSLAERPSRAGKRPRSATRVAGILRNDRESAWAGELRPGNDAARPPALRYDNIDTTVLPEHLDVREQPRSAVLERILGPWDRLDARYKVVVASSAAFVLCNMVRARCLHAHVFVGKNGCAGVLLIFPNTHPNGCSLPANFHVLPCFCASGLGLGLHEDTTCARKAACKLLV